MRTYPLPLCAVLFLTLAGPALAVDGVLEINQTCVVQSGCFAGDTPGFPLTISTPSPSLPAALLPIKLQPKAQLTPSPEFLEN